MVISREAGRIVKVETSREDGLFADPAAVIRRIEEVLGERAALGEVAYVYGVSRDAALYGVSRDGARS